MSTYQDESVDALAAARPRRCSGLAANTHRVLSRSPAPVRDRVQVVRGILQGLYGTLVSRRDNGRVQIAVPLVPAGAVIEIDQAAVSLLDP